jgi:hypothetical protein
MQIEKLLPALDFKPETDSVDDQGPLGSCVAQAGATALEIAYKRAGVPTNFSSMFLYYYVQKDSGSLGTDGGGYPGSLAQILNEYGCCTEADWPYDKTKLGVEPPPAVRAKARALVPAGSVKMYGIGAVAYSVTAIKRELNRGRPVVLGMFAGGLMSIKAGTPWRTHVCSAAGHAPAGHAVCVIGYDDEAQRFLVENSWGPAWGDGGFFGIPYSYFGAADTTVISALSFDKLPVKDVPVTGYVPYGPAVYDTATGLLEVPHILARQSEFGAPSNHKRVTAKVHSTGEVIVNPANFMQWGTNYVLFKVFLESNTYIGMPELLIDGTLHKNVVLKNAKVELLEAYEEC